MSCKILNMSENLDRTPQILAGILKHIKEITFFLNPVEDSYKRLGKCKAPSCISWAKENRSQLIRLPATKTEPRIELRSPDPEANPYLALSLLIYAAMDGIKNNLQPPAPVKVNLFDADKSVIDKLDTLPESLSEAYEIAVNSDFVTSIISKDIIENFKK